MTDRLYNGVKRRVDGKGDGWALAHRCLGQGCQMSDFDALFGVMAFGANTGNRLFVEYEPDNYERRLEVIRRHAVIAMFDRKATEDAAFKNSNLCNCSFYLHVCRALAAYQKYPPRFFFCVGGQVPPWSLIEIDICTGRRIAGQDTVIRSTDHAEWSHVWDAIGLKELRNRLREQVAGRSIAPRVAAKPAPSSPDRLIDEAIQALIYDDKRTAKELLYEAADALRHETQAKAA